MRIISMGPGATEILFAIGRGPQVVGRTTQCDYPEEVAELPVVDLPDETSAAGTAVDADVLADLEPSLVVTVGSAPHTGGAGLIDMLAGLPTTPGLVTADPESLLDVIETIARVGEVVDAEAGAARLTTFLRSQLVKIGSSVASRARPRVAVVEWAEPLRTPDPWIPEMVRIAGGENVFGSSGEPARPATKDELADGSPEVLVVAFHGFTLYEMQARLRTLTALGAWPAPARSARMIAIDPMFVSRPGPRLVAGVELLAWALHRPHPVMQPPVGRVAELIEAGWVDLTAVQSQVEEPA